MSVEWPKLALGLTFHPAAEMKPIRVSTCLCPFHVICICKPRAPIAAQLHVGATLNGQAASLKERMGDRLRFSPALPDTLPWEKQHGPLAACAASSLTRRTSSSSAALCPTALLDLPLNKGRVGPSAPSWEGTSPCSFHSQRTVATISLVIGYESKGERDFISKPSGGIWRWPRSHVRIDYMTVITDLCAFMLLYNQPDWWGSPLCLFSTWRELCILAERSWNRTLCISSFWGRWLNDKCMKYLNIYFMLIAFLLIACTVLYVLSGGHLRSGAPPTQVDGSRDYTRRVLFDQRNASRVNCSLTKRCHQQLLH